MATGNPFLGTARKSIGDVTLYRSRGQQRARVRVREIANPRSFLQLLQRSVLANVSHLYSAGQEIFNHAFQGVPAGADSQSRFLKVNTALLRSLFIADFNAAAEEDECVARIGARGLRVPVPFEGLILSEGNYDQNIWSFNNAANTFELPDLQASTLIKDYAAANNLVPGDIFTFVCFNVRNDVAPAAQYGENLDAYGKIFYTSFVYVQLKVKDDVLTNENDLEPTDTLDTIFDIKGDGLAVTNVSNIKFSQPGIGTLAITSGSTPGGIGCIRSRYDSDKRSTSKLMPSAADWECGLTYHFMTAAWGDGSPIEMPTRILTGVNFM